MNNTPGHKLRIQVPHELEAVLVSRCPFSFQLPLRSACGLVVMVAQVIDPASIPGERSFCSLKRIGAEV